MAAIHGRPVVSVEETERAIDETRQVAAVGTRLRGRTPHKIVADLSSPTSNGISIDGMDVSAMLRGVEIRAHVGELTEIRFDVAPGQLAALRAVIPEAQLTIDVDVTVLEVALKAAFDEIGNASLGSIVNQLARSLHRRISMTRA